MPETPIERRVNALKSIEATYRSASETHRWLAKGLTRRQERVRNNLEEAVREIRCWSGVTPVDEFEKNHQKADFVAFEKAIGRAIRARLLHHPVIRDWLAARRSLGDWHILRNFRLGLESGVNKTMPKEDFFIIYEAQGLIEQGYGPEAIRKALIEKLKHPTTDDREKWAKWSDLAPADIERLIKRLECSRQNFHRWLKRLKII